MSRLIPILIALFFPITSLRGNPGAAACFLRPSHSESTDCVARPDTLIPRIFIKGQNEKLEELLNTQYPKQILYPFKDNAQNAFAAWANMLWEMEKFSDKVGFDIRGIKAFATFYFDRKGNIQHIAYSLKGNSRYFQPEELDKFFRQFMSNYRMPVNSKYSFQHEFTLALPYPKLIEQLPAEPQKH